jgi:hypothetical protein
VSATVTFAFHLEPSSGGEQTWLVEADIVHEHHGYWADITGARPQGEASGVYDVSDLEEALADEGEGRTLHHVQQAAIDAYSARFSEAS